MLVQYDIWLVSVAPCLAAAYSVELWVPPERRRGEWKRNMQRFTVNVVEGGESWSFQMFWSETQRSYTTCPTGQVSRTEGTVVGVGGVQKVHLPEVGR